jgi:hypothetical protein
VNDALGLSVRPAKIPAEKLTAAPRQDLVAPPRLTAIAVPGEPRLRLAADAVADALEARGATRPAVRESATGAALSVRFDPRTGGADAYRIDRAGAGFTVTAAGTGGAAGW